MLDVDGAFLNPQTLGGVGGVIRNNLGEFIATFAYRKEHMVDHLCMLKLWLSKMELNFFKQWRSIFVAIVHSDCLLIAVQAIQSDEEDLSPLGNLIEDVRNSSVITPSFYLSCFSEY